MEYLLKVHESSSGRVVALSDVHVLGKKFFENDIILDVDADFFGGKKVRADEIISAVKDASNANIVGNDVVSLLVEKGIIAPTGVKTVGGVKFAHIYRV